MKKIKKEDHAEGLCFVCKDGGSLRICDYRGCLKCYHPKCVNEDGTFLASKERWGCGRHYCFNCNKASEFQCFSCPMAVCGRESCFLKANLVLVRGKKGLCSLCLDLSALIEGNMDVDSDGEKVDFNDRTTQEFLFKEYWYMIKGKENLTSENILSTKNSFKKGPELESSRSKVGNEKAKSAKTMISPCTLSTHKGPSSDASNGFHCQDSARDAPAPLDHPCCPFDDNKFASSILLNHCQIPSDPLAEPSVLTISPTIEDSISKCRIFSMAAYDSVTVQEKEVDNKISKIEADIMQLQQKLADARQEKKEILVHKHELAARIKDRMDELSKSNQNLALWESKRKQAEDNIANVLSAWQSFKGCFLPMEEKQHVRRESFNEEFSLQFHNLASEHALDSSLEKEPHQCGSLGKHSRLINIESAEMENKKDLPEVIELSDDDPGSANAAGFDMKGAKLKTETKKSNGRLSGKRIRAGTEKLTKEAKKALKDPKKPKTPASPFIIFMDEFRKQYEEKHPNNKFNVALNRAGEEWKSISRAEKAPYIEESEKRMIEYNTYTKACKKLTEGLNATDEVESYKVCIDDDEDD